MAIGIGKDHVFPDEKTLRLREKAIKQRISMALWIQHKYKEAFDKALMFQFFEGIHNSSFMSKVMKNNYLQTLLGMCQNEWLFVEARLSIKDKDVRAMDLTKKFLAPRLDRFSRMSLELFSRTPLSLYEVVDREPGRGCWLRDLFEPAESDPVFAVSLLASSRLEPGDVLATRLLRYEDGWNDMGGALLPFQYEQAMELVQDMPVIIDVERLLRSGQRLSFERIPALPGYVTLQERDYEDLSERDLVSLAILHSWMNAVIEARHLNAIPGGPAWKKRRPEEGAGSGSGAAEKGRKGRIGRNDPCPCGSGRKYKACCLARGDEVQEEEMYPISG